MLRETAQQRLATAAFRYKKSWLLVAIIIGIRLGPDERTIPDYSNWSCRRLEGHVDVLKHDLLHALSKLRTGRLKRVPQSAVRWLADRFDEWYAEGQGIYTISTLQEFEANVTDIRAGIELDAPPYAEILIQPGHPAAFRHPEYMLSRDLELLVRAAHDAESILVRVNWREPPKWAASASENAQGLARTVVLTCFNLLESFTAGLAREHLLTSSVDADTTAKLTNTRDALRKRILAVPRAITGREPPLDINKPPLSVLFAEVKRYRDAFVHCEPGPATSERGYDKQALFHDVGPELVEKAVQLTRDVIRTLWKHVHGRAGPKWLDRAEAREDGLIVGPNSAFT